MRIKLAQTNSKKRYLVFTTDDARKRAVDPTRLLAYSQPQNRYFRARVEKVGLSKKEKSSEGLVEVAGGHRGYETASWPKRMAPPEHPLGSWRTRNPSDAGKTANNAPVD